MSHCEKGHIALRYGLYWRPKQPFSQDKKGRFLAEMGCFGGCFYCTIRLIRLISPIGPIGYGCTLILREFAPGAVLLSKKAENQRHESRVF